MTKPTPDRGLLHVMHGGDTVVCADHKCGRMIYPEMPCCVDAATGDIYCDPCGLCLRYSRKKEAERNARAAGCRPAKKE